MQKCDLNERKDKIKKNSNKNSSLQGCGDQYSTMTNCLNTEKNRIKQKELELRDRILGLKTQEKPLEMPIGSNELKFKEKVEVPMIEADI